MNTSIKIQGSAALLLFGLGLFTSVFSGCGAPVKPAILKCNCACNNSSYKAHTDDYERFSSECKTWCADFGVPGSAQTCFESDVPGGAGGTAGTAGTGAAGKTGTGGSGGSGGSGGCTIDKLQLFPYCVVCTTDILHCSTEFDFRECAQSTAKDEAD